MGEDGNRMTEDRNKMTADRNKDTYNFESLHIKGLPIHLLMHGIAGPIGMRMGVQYVADTKEGVVFAYKGATIYVHESYPRAEVFGSPSARKRGGSLIHKIAAIEEKVAPNVRDDLEARRKALIKEGHTPLF